VHISHLNPLNAQLNPFCHLLALLGAHHILHVSRIRVKHPSSGLIQFKILANSEASSLSLTVVWVENNLTSFVSKIIINIPILTVKVKIKVTGN
jgi:hypothetical protein